MAAVGAVYTIKPFVRTADDVIEEVMREKARQRRPSPQNKRVRTELLVGKVALFLWVAQETIRRNPQGTKPVIFLSDAEETKRGGGRKCGELADWDSHHRRRRS